MNEIITTLIASILTAGISILGVIMANRKSSAILEYKVDELDRHVKEHNNLVKRMYCCEEGLKLQEQRLSRIEDDKKG